MSPHQPERHPGPDAVPDTPSGDPWHAFGYLVSGVLGYGLLGWLVDRWLGTSFVVGIGIVVGAGLGIYLTIARFSRPSAVGASTPAGEQPAVQEKT